MNTSQLLAHFEKISEASDALPRMRRFVLDLAVRGKLVPPDAKDEPASKLLKRIAAERACLVKAGRIRDKLSLPAVSDDEMPFEVPASWCWVRFADLVEFSAGRTPSRNDASFWNNGDHAWVSIGDMIDGQVLATTRETVSFKAQEQVFRSEPEAPGTIIMSFKLTIGKIARLGISAFHNEAIISIKPFLDDLDAYLFKALPQFARQGNTKGAIKGATLNRDSLSNILFPLPPIAEQRRIVAKVDELMGLCDGLEAAQVEREQRRDRLMASNLSRLNKPDPDTFQDDARFALNVLPALTTRPEQIKELRQTVLNLAVRGKLVPQVLGDEEGSQLLMRIAAEKVDLVRRRLIRREEPLAPIQALELPFDVPPSWMWCRIGDAFLFTQYGTSQKSHPTEKGVPVLTMGNIQDGSVIWGTEKKIPEASEELPALFLNKLDLLYNRTNSAELVGKTGILLIFAES